MKTFPIPESPISDWDKKVMKIYPFRYMLNRTGIFDDATAFAGEHFSEGSFTWKGPIFFFKNEKDAMWFKLRWS